MKLYKAEEAANILRLTKDCVYKFARKGLIKCYRMKSGQIRFSDDHIKEFLGGEK